MPRFPCAGEVPTPSGADGWRELYGYALLFGEDPHEGRSEYENSAFWFHDGVHWPEPVTPWEAGIVECAMASLSQFNTRHLVIPPSNGIDVRILNGYVYLSAKAVPSEDVEGRINDFVHRAGHYYDNWDDLYAQWRDKVADLLDALRALDFSALPEVEDFETVVQPGLGTGSGYRLIGEYRLLRDLAHRMWQYHFEFLNLGYAAYLDFFAFCKQQWPSIPDLSIASMVSGVDVDLFRPDDELKKLAKQAVDLDVADVLANGHAEDVFARLAESADGRAWLAAYAQSAEPWFNFSSGSGFYHSDRVWIEEPDVPLSFIRSYASRLQRGEDLARPLERIAAERDQLVSDYRQFLPDADSISAFDRRLALARLVFPYVENHNLYIEHMGHAIIWRKMREVGRLLADAGFWSQPNDVFYLSMDEVDSALVDHYRSWATPAPAAGPSHWPAIIAKRRAIIAALRQWAPTKALGQPPAIVAEPFTVMLWGITADSIAAWLGVPGPSSGELSGFAASPGQAEGVARVITSADELDEVREGEILVAPLTAPSWAPTFGRIAATVTDSGGIMSHAAIVCREYGLPAVTGTGLATTVIRTGMRIRVDGSTGRVYVLEAEPLG